MQVLGILNAKGGVGKTTLATNLAYLLSKSNKVLFIDLDCQLNSTKYLGGACGLDDIDIVDMFKDDSFSKDLMLEIIEPAVVNGKESDSLYRIKASDKLLNLQEILSTKRKCEYILQKRLKLVSEYFDFAIIDSGPALNTVLDNLMIASDRFIIPVTHKMSIDGVNNILELIAYLKDIEVSEIDYKLVWNMRDAREKSVNQYIESQKELYKFTDTALRSNTSAKHNETSDLILSAFKSPLSTDYKNLTEEIFGE